MSANGRLTASELATIQSGLSLAVKPARAFKRLQAAAKKDLGRTIAAAQKAGAYRSLAVQKAIQAAFDSHDPARRAEWNLDPDSTVRPADPGYSNHGDGLAVDIVGTPIDAAFVKLAARYGFTFPFGTRDPRHALHDGKTATAPFAPATVHHVVYTVKAGDTLSAIAGHYRTTVRRLLLLNPAIHDADVIHVGQKIKVT